jgi:hypothetical protein
MYVCQRCIEDMALQKVVRENSTSQECDYCGHRSDNPIAADLDDVLEFMDRVISEEYGDPNDELPWDGREGGWQGEVLDVFDLFADIEFYVENEQLLNDIRDHFSEREYCQKDYFASTPSQRVLVAWEKFKTVVKHQRRYTFWTSLDDGEPEYHPDHLPPGHMMGEIADIIHQVGPVKTTPKGTEFWRVRVHLTTKPLKLPSDFTSPPTQYANQPNRMSPSGVSMFYGCDDKKTAYFETVDPDDMSGKIVSGARFQAFCPLNFLDLTAIPGIRSFFATDRDVRHAVQFLQEFARDLSRPIKKDGRQHIEYVPTQVFTEYVRFELKTSGNEPFHGIKYRSSKDQRGCYVIFADQNQCLSTDSKENPQLLDFVVGSIEDITKS